MLKSHPEQIALLKQYNPQLGESLDSNNLEEIAKHSTTIITSLPSPKTVTDVFEGSNGLLNYINHQAFLFDHSILIFQ